MPLYFFDVTDTGEAVADETGTELATLQEARSEALKTLAEIAKDELPDGDYREFVISIREEDGPAILSASLSLRVEQKG